MTQIKLGDKVAAAVVAGHSPGLRIGTVEKVHTANGPWTPLRYTLRLADGSTSVVAAGRTVRFYTDADLADVFDMGVSVAGRYGHEDGWDSEENPYNDNPYREEAR